MWQRPWWAAGGAGVAVAALIGVVAVMSAGSSGAGDTADGATAGDTNPSDANTGDARTAGGAARSAAPSGSGRSGDPGTAVAPSATRPHQTRRPLRTSQLPPRPSVVAPRAQVPRTDMCVALAIRSYELVAPDRVRVRYATGLPACRDALNRVYVSEYGDRVLVTLRVRPTAQPPTEPCPDIALAEGTVVRLDSPLGDRAVVDGATGRAVPRGHVRAPG